GLQWQPHRGRSSCRLPCTPSRSTPCEAVPGRYTSLQPRPPGECSSLPSPWKAVPGRYKRLQPRSTCECSSLPSAWQEPECPQDLTPGGANPTPPYVDGRANQIHLHNEIQAWRRASVAGRN